MAMVFSYFSFVVALRFEWVADWSAGLSGLVSLVWSVGAGTLAPCKGWRRVEMTGLAGSVCVTGLDHPLEHHEATTGWL